MIGVNTAIFSPSGGSVGIGFAIPADVTDNIVKQLISGGKITRGYLGATIQAVTPEIADSLGIPGKKGALVAELVPGGPAQKAGVQSGDVVLEVNGHTVKDSTDLTRQVAASHTGDMLNLNILRAGKQITVAVKSGVRPSEADLAKQQQQDQDDQSPTPSAPHGQARRAGPVGGAARRRGAQEVRPRLGHQRRGDRGRGHRLGRGQEGRQARRRAGPRGRPFGDQRGRCERRHRRGQKAGRTSMLVFIFRDGRQLACRSSSTAPPTRPSRPGAIADMKGGPRGPPFLFVLGRSLLHASSNELAFHHRGGRRRFFR